MSLDGNPTRIYFKDGLLNFKGDRLATREEYELGVGEARRRHRCVESIFESLHPEENIQIDDGYFILNESLDLVQDWQVV